jgi:hypothetical protein
MELGTGDWNTQRYHRLNSMSPQQLHDRVAPTYLQATISPPFAAFEKEDSMLTKYVGYYSSPAVVIEGLCFTEPMPCLVSPGVRGRGRQ